MAITLAEAKVGMADKVDQQIVDMFRRSSLLLDNMVLKIPHFIFLQILVMMGWKR